MTADPSKTTEEMRAEMEVLARRRDGDVRQLEGLRRQIQVLTFTLQQEKLMRTKSDQEAQRSLQELKAVVAVYGMTWVEFLALEPKMTVAQLVANSRQTLAAQRDEALTKLSTIETMVRDPEERS